MSAKFQVRVCETCPAFKDRIATESIEYAGSALQEVTAQYRPSRASDKTGSRIASIQALLTAATAIPSEVRQTSNRDQDKTAPAVAATEALLQKALSAVEGAAARLVQAAEPSQQLDQHSTHQGLDKAALLKSSTSQDVITVSLS